MDEKLQAAISRLAERGANWALLADTDPATFMDLVTERIDAQAERMQARYLEGIEDGSRRSATVIAEQAERIRDLEAKRDPNYINPAMIRRETATAIAREIEECLQKMALTIPSVDAERVCRGICRAFGADV